MDEREFALKRLPPALDGVAIAHVTDLHLCGRIGIEYFQEAMRQTNELGADLIAVTGDIVDHRHCFDWLPSTLGRLRVAVRHILRAREP